MLALPSKFFFAQVDFGTVSSREEAGKGEQRKFSCKHHYRYYTNTIKCTIIIVYLANHPQKLDILLSLKTSWSAALNLVFDMLFS